jgi:hypothetical protein
MTGHNHKPYAGLLSLPATINCMPRSLGNALHRLQAFVQPHMKHVVTQTFQQADAEELGDQCDSRLHIRRQAVRIQRGDEMDQVKALLTDSQGR